MTEITKRMVIYCIVKLEITGKIYRRKSGSARKTT